VLLESQRALLVPVSYFDLSKKVHLFLVDFFFNLLQLMLFFRWTWAAPFAYSLLDCLRVELLGDLLSWFLLCRAFSYSYPTTTTGMLAFRIREVGCRLIILDKWWDVRRLNGRAVTRRAGLSWANWSWRFLERSLVLVV
jgi:hypothetical protein